MKYRSVGEVIDSPKKQWIPEAHLGVEFDYSFMGKGMGQTGVHLFIKTIIVDSFENQFTRKTEHILQRREVKDCIRWRIQEHLKSVGVDMVQIRGLLRDFEVDMEKVIPYDPANFKR
ncbi:hypothetical protein SAMN04488034_10920 [Salinimicrobium catena]|uniref:Uncharacterized protein n=1 Tax=Salinimicrobium catena TaxID=390640 RepID=A0A1H5P571_9FLAO|nr:hypothetical protein [Salinimicrobium catena]SDL72106.1 hypothetical protein SAMN04488140_10962 [Salinimicrobium catena]SEF08999.1 hypothetical protein SAMN04488034_10920 [Salinimicrobium catena]